MVTPEIIERAGKILAERAPPPAKVILFGSRARGDARAGSDLDFLVIEPEVALKAVLARRAIRFERNHDLALLAQRIAATGTGLPVDDNR